jgi:hypothetical protein
MAASFLRSSHGKGASTALVRVEVPPIDELSAGAPAGPAMPSPVPPAGKPKRSRQGDGKGAAGRLRGRPDLAREAGRKGALATNARRRDLRVLESLGLRHAVPEGAVLALWPYLDDAERFAKAEVERLAQSVGGGVVPPNVASIVQTAALQLAGSRMAIAQGKVEIASRLGNDSRQNLLAAHELCAREAKARASMPGARPDWMVRLGIGEPEPEPEPDSDDDGDDDEGKGQP